MAAIFSWLASLLTGPLLNSALDAYKAKLAAGTSSESLAADLAAKEVSLQQRELELQTQYRIAALGRWYEPDKLMGYTVAVYLAKLLIWDKMFGMGRTDPLVGWVETTANLIVAFYFGKRTFENVARIIRK